MIEADRYVDQAYVVLFGKRPNGMSRQRCRALVMEHWDVKKFAGDHYLQMIARKALSQIGLHWHKSHGAPHTFELIAERLSELLPGLGTANITQSMLQDILVDRYPN